MITLHGFGPMAYRIDASPFVIKAHALLRMADLAYESKTGARGGPKGKRPFITDDGETIPDSTFIRWHIEKKYGVDFDAGYDARERGIAWTVEKTLEDNLYFIVVHDRWLVDANFANGPATFFAKVPAPLRPLVMAMIRRKVRQTASGQGIARHPQGDIDRIGVASVNAIADILGERPYLLGERPCGADATLFAFTAGLLVPGFTSGTRTAAEARPNLVAYVERMRAKYFPEVTL